MSQFTNISFADTENPCETKKTVPPTFPSSSYISTNDMITAFGWMMKRVLSRQPSYNLSIVVNLRGHSDVHPLLFGNALTHVVVQYPAFPNNDNYNGKRHITLEEISQAALAIRQALNDGVREIPHRLMESRLGQLSSSNSMSTSPTFSTTSWRQFPLARIRFSDTTTDLSILHSNKGEDQDQQHQLYKNNTMNGFHGHPAHPLPVGETYASVIAPCIATKGAGCIYELLLPADQVDEARDMHARLADLYLEKYSSKYSEIDLGVEGREKLSAPYSL